MTNYHPNTIKLLRLEKEIIQLGWNKNCFSEFVARKSGELGNDYPSDKAIHLAEKILKDFREEMRRRNIKPKIWRIA